jgi:hypothetical protein
LGVDVNTNVIKIIAAVPGIPMLVNALLFIAQPERVTADLGMPLLEGVGLSTQLADLGAFFTFSAFLIFYGVLKSKGECLRIVALLIGLAAFLRIVAWAVNDAALASALIGAEILLVVWLWLSAKYIDKLKQVNGANE